MNILIIICTGFVPWGGLTTVAMNYYRSMNKDGIQIDFASNNDAPQELLEELHNHGSRYIQLPLRKQIFFYVHKLYKILKDYDVVHCHTTTPTAKRLSKFLRPMLLKMYTQAVAVSEDAGNWLYGKNNFIVLNNAISVQKYQYNQELGNQVRKELHISDDTIVYGHIGKMNISKNHEFLVKIFYEIKKKKENSVLLLVGDGPLRKEIEKLVKELHLNDSVIFIGMSIDTVKWFQAMDCFIFPSNWEGFPLAFTEAQANGLKCFISNTVTKSAKILPTTEILDIEKSASACAEQIYKCSLERAEKNEILKQFRNVHLDIEQEAEKLRLLYIEKCKE